MIENIREKYYTKTMPIYRGEGCWNTTQVEIFKKENGVEEKIGEYERNYSSFAKETFEPFVQYGKEYALFSRNYMYVEVMELPSCNIIIKEPKETYGFCVTEIYVPNDWDLFKTKSEYEDAIEDWEGAKSRQGTKLFPIFEGFYGFVAGCIWGDDSSWKLRYVNLLDLARGKIEYQDRFGYFPLMFDLRKSIDLDIIYDSVVDHKLDIVDNKWVNTNNKPEDLEITMQIPKLKYFVFDINKPPVPEKK